jgi:Short C-terminal domain
MFRRRPLMRAAVIGGGAYVAGKHMANKSAQQADYQAEQDQRISDLEQQQAPPPATPAAPAPAAPAPAAPPAEAGAPSMLDQLNQLAALHQQGVLSDDEFTAAKAKLLGT